MGRCRGRVGVRLPLRGNVVDADRRADQLVGQTAECDCCVGMSCIAGQSHARRADAAVASAAGESAPGAVAMAGAIRGARTQLSERRAVANVPTRRDCVGTSVVEASSQGRGQATGVETDDTACTQRRTGQEWTEVEWSRPGAQERWPSHGAGVASNPVQDLVRIAPERIKARPTETSGAPWHDHNRGESGPTDHSAALTAATRPCLIALATA